MQTLENTDVEAVQGAFFTKNHARTYQEPPRTFSHIKVICMILDEIRLLKKRIEYQQLKIDCFSVVPAIRYDKDRVQTSISAGSYENQILNHIEDKRKLKRMQNKLDAMIASVDLSVFTKRQRQFIKLYYFAGLTQTQCCKYLHIKISAVCRMKQRVEHKCWYAE